MDERPPSSLHVCNLANVAYGYCKILSAAGYPVDLRCHDLRHLMSQPEWDDVELRAEDFPDENDFYRNTADFRGYHRPPWYQSGTLYADAIAPLAPTREAGANGAPRAAAASHPAALPPRSFAQRSYETLRALCPPPARDLLRPLVRHARFAKHALRSGASLGEYRRLARARFGPLVEASKRHGREWEISQRMLVDFQAHALWLGRHLARHDVVFAYVIAPIYAMLRGDAPYVSVEIGTMRDIPFDGSNQGKLLALAYRLSNHVLITNPDVRRQAEELGVPRYSFCPHPLDEDVYAPDEGASPLRRELLAKHDADFVLFAPARQNWEIKGNDRYLRAFAEVVRRGVRAVLVVPGWGQEIERSQRLCETLGIARHVSWIPPQSEPVLVKYYRASDFVLDQFVLGVFGLITPKALSCGAVVLTSYDEAPNAWCFAERPPLVACRAEREIADAVTGLAANPDRRRELSMRSRQWVLHHHGKAAILRILDDAMKSARVDFAARAR